MLSKQKYWYFSQSNCKLRYDDNRLITPGSSHWVFKKPKLCHQGLHASVNLFNALGYCTGPILWRVELRGLKDKGDDKVAAMNRKYLWGVNFKELVLDEVKAYIPDDELSNKMREHHKINGVMGHDNIVEAANRYTTAELALLNSFIILQTEKRDHIFGGYMRIICRNLPALNWEQIVIDKREDYVV